MNTKKTRIRSAIALFALSAAILSSAACKSERVDPKKVTAKASENTSVSETSKSESSVWHPSTSSAASEKESKASEEPSVQQSSEVSQVSVNPMFDVPPEYCDDGIFSDYYVDAYRYLSTMTLDEKIGQMILSSLPAEDEIEFARENHIGGFLLFSNDFAYKSKDQVISQISSLVISQKIPLCIAVDEEGGDVVRISSKKELSPHEFMSPRELYKNGGMAYIQSDADEKATLLHELGIDVNLAPVCDISTNKSDFMYSRSLGEDAKTTAEYVKIVTELSQKRGVSVTLKHFPGYGQNVDTHTGLAVDKRTLKEFKAQDFLPFQSGIEAGAHCVLVSHNIVECMDKEHPASLSPAVHNILRKDMNFSGLIITDDLAMGAISAYTGKNTPAVAAVLAGNDLLIMPSGMVESACLSIKEAVDKKVITEKQIDQSVLRILAWKYAKGIM